ncbi:MAG: ABC transporter permease [Proteobacteria bacterium]|nr:ABC transporter permease [Pseudomonadota bacterium]MDA0951881.1 ABC transporter permease [Pseudomonadota bacterium]MDA1072730.1 ABC transporter permease [Pseudomonadota bacterium]
MTASAAPLPPRRRLLPAWFRDVFSRPSGAIGLAIIAVHLAIALLAPLIVPYDFAAQDSKAMFADPSAAHWLGGDHLGRDVLTRTLMGGREAILVSTMATGLAVLWGGLFGIFLAFAGRFVDEASMRMVDALLAIPWILFVMLFVAGLGTGMGVLIPILGISYGLSIVRVVRAAALDVVTRDFILAARARGERRSVVIVHEMLPNVFDTLAVQAAMTWSWMLLGFSSLSFLGFGATPPTPDWGLMISDARSAMMVSPWPVLAPMVALSSLIIGINLLSDGLAKALGVDRMKKAAV